MTQTPQETLKQLQEIFPPFQAWWEKSEESPPPVTGVIAGIGYTWTHHAVLRALLGFVTARYAEFSPLQLREFAAWVDRALESGGDLENALVTCFLEQLRRGKFRRVLVPHLSAKARLYA